MSMTKSDYNKIMRAYDQRKATNSQLQNKRMEEVFSNIPQLETIHKKISSLGLTAIQKTIANPEHKATYAQELTLNLDKLKQQKATLLKSNGYPADYLEPIYTCSDCKDSGYIQNQKCHCLKQAIIDYAYEQSNLKQILEKENFSTFSFDYYSKEKDPKTGMSSFENMRSVHQACLNFVEDFNTTFNNLILYGRSGLGKTFLCNSIAKELLDQGKTVIYLSSFQLFRLFENYRFHKEEEIVTNDDIETIFQCDLLIIDDLGTEFNNALTSAELFNCLNSRLMNRRATVISTNLNPNEWVNKYSERIVSRIFGYYTQLKLFGSDIRLMRYQ